MDVDRLGQELSNPRPLAGTINRRGITRAEKEFIGEPATILVTPKEGAYMNGTRKSLKLLAASVCAPACAVP
jgi:hypothetical protein